MDFNKDTQDEGMNPENSSGMSSEENNEGNTMPVPDQEPKTPYQTPVRDSSAYGPQQPPHTDEPFGASQQAADYYTYRQWQEQQGKDKKKKRGKKPLIVAASVLVAALMFAAGAMVGGLGGSLLTGNQQQTQTTAEAKLPDNTPKLDITEKTAAVSAGDDGLTGAEIFKKVSPSIVSIQSEYMKTGNMASGSGIIMKSDGYIITNNHVVSGADKVTVILNDGKKYQAQIIGLDEKTDLGVIKIDATGLTPAEFGDSSKLVVGDRAFAIGSPGGVQLQNSFTGGYISAINRDITIDDRVMTLLQTDASINPGNSGGALINKYGQVIGVTSAKLGISYYEGLGFAIPMSTAQGIVNELIAYGHVTGRPAIGVSGYNITEQMAAYYQIPQGLMIESVDNRSDAYAKGVKQGDIITGINGTTTKNMTEINAIKNKLKAGNTITLNLYRAGKKLNVTIKLVDENDLGSNNTNQQEQQQQQPQQENPFGSNDGNSFFQIP